MCKQMQPEKLFYRGPSMSGTFRLGDRLRIEKIPLARLRKGDVVVFCSPQANADDWVVHRIIRLGANGPITRGDNNATPDGAPLSENIYSGKVYEYERSDRIHKSWNGRAGMLRARVLHARLHVFRIGRFLLGRPYRLLKRSGIIAKVWRPEISTIHFETQSGPLVKYVHKGKTVASCWTRDDRWRFRRPYDFIIHPGTKS